MTECYNCNITYKDENEIKGTFSEHAPSNRNKHRYLDRDLCGYCLPIIRDKNIRENNNLINFVECSSCELKYRWREIKTCYSKYSDNNEYYYCEKCFLILWDEKMKEKGKIEIEKISYEELKNQLENEKLKSEENLQDFIDKSEDWHQKQISEKDKRISELELLLKNKEIIDLNKRLQELENKYYELITNDN